VRAASFNKIAVGAIAALCLSSSVRAQLLTAQEQCVKQSSQAFLEWQKKHDPASPQETRGSYRNYKSHYNTKLARCLVLIERTVYKWDGKITWEEVTSQLADANERHTYAFYFWRSDQVKKFWEGKPFICTLTPTISKADNKLCSKKTDFDAFVGPYMQQ
jgi:hypothetical protein